MTPMTIVIFIPTMESQWVPFFSVNFFLNLKWGLLLLQSFRLMISAKIKCLTTFYVFLTSQVRIISTSVRHVWRWRHQPIRCRDSKHGRVWGWDDWWVSKRFVQHLNFLLHQDVLLPHWCWREVISSHHLLHVLPAGVSQLSAMFGEFCLSPTQVVHI